MAQLKQLGIADNTIIIFPSDNGFYLGEHGLEGKWYGHEESIRVPLIVYDPRLPARQQKGQPQQIALNVDIAPTLLGLAQVPVPRQMQGVDLLQLLQNKVAERLDFFYQHNFAQSPRLPNVEGVVTKDFKYMLYTEHGYEELYSICQDPKETTNLARDPGYQAQLEALRQRYKELEQAAL